MSDRSEFTYYTGIQGKTIWRWDGTTLQVRSEMFPEWRNTVGLTHEALVKMDHIHEIPEP